MKKSLVGKNTKVLISIIVATACLISFQAAHTAMPSFNMTMVPSQPDYSEHQNWLALPENSDQYPVDVFWVYPTILSDDKHWLMAVNDANLQRLAKTTIEQQASVFQGQANIYAPLYRQMNISALGLKKDKQDTLSAFGKKDILDALRFYMESYNNGRPFILAGHSQGSKILLDIVVENWGALGFEDELVAGYLIGWSITTDDIERNKLIEVCKSPSQTGCFVAYNTVAEGMQKVAPTILPGSIVVNPMSWEIDEKLVPASENIGAVCVKDEGSRETKPQFTSARRYDGGLVIEAASSPYLKTIKTHFPQGIFHVYDYSIFFENIRANVAQRIGGHLSER